MSDGDFNIDEHIKKLRKMAPSFGVRRDPETGHYSRFPLLPKEKKHVNRKQRKEKSQDNQQEPVLEKSQTAETEKRPPKVFLSYSVDDRHSVGQLKTHLEKYGLDCFPSHEDITPSLEWVDEILHNIEACDVFIPYLTLRFAEYRWTDQECGIAFFLGKMILPLSVELVPYGLLNKFQGMRYDSMKPDQMATEIIQTIIHEGTIDGLQDFFIERFMASKNFATSSSFAKMLNLYSSFSEKQVKEIYRASIENDQIHRAFGAQDFLRKLTATYGDAISSEEKTLLSWLMDKGSS